MKKDCPSKELCNQLQATQDELIQSLKQQAIIYEEQIKGLHEVVGILKRHCGIPEDEIRREG